MKVPSQALSDALVEMFKDRLKPDKKALSYEFYPQLRASFIIWIRSEPPVNHFLTIKPLDYKNNDRYQFVIKGLLEVPQTHINTGFLPYFNLLPLNCRRRLRGYIIEDAVHVVNFIDNPYRNLL